MLLLFLRFIRGFVIVDVKGRFPERFINLLNRRRITYWDMLPRGEGYTARLFVRDYLRIRPLAKKAEVRLKLSERRGLPFIIRRYKIRRGIAVGAVLAVAVMAFLSQFIWEVNIDGIKRISQSSLNQALYECGLYPGAFKAAVDTDAVERRLMLELPEIRWVSVNALNNIAQIQIKEKAQPPKQKTASYPCNIKAERDGIVTKTVVYSGSKLIEKGSAVKKDQLLVSAVVENSEDKLSYVHSSADIFADIFLSKNIKLKKNQTALIPKENYSEKSNLSFLRLNLPFKLSSSATGLYADNFYDLNLCINNVNLPVSEKLCRRFCFEKQSLCLKPKDAERILNKKLALYECFAQGRGRIKSRTVRTLEKNGEYIIKAVYTINKNIAVKQRIRVEQ